MTDHRRPHTHTKVTMMKEKEESLPLLFNTHRDAAIVSVVKTNLSACEIVSVEGKLMVAKTVISGCR